MSRSRGRQRARQHARQAKPSNRVTSVSDEVFAQFIRPGGPADLAGITVSQESILGLSAVFRAVSLVSGTLASLPLRTLREGENGTPERVTSVFDDPDGPDGQTQFEWTETLFAYLMIHGKAGALKVRNEAGSLVRLPLVHPASFTEEMPTGDERPSGGLWFRVQLEGGESVRLDADDFWYVPALSLDGVGGMGLLQAARFSLGTSLAAEQSAGRMFTNGALISGLASPDTEDDLDPEDLPIIKRQLSNATSGSENVGAIALINRRLKFTPWTMTAVDAQFLQSRQFQIEDVARWTGVPPHLLMQTEKQTSWGTGVEEQNRALGRTVLAPWASRLEGRGSRLLVRPRWIEIDFTGLERPSPDKEIELLIKQVGAGLLTINEARAIRNLPPLPEPAPPVDGDREEGSDAPPAE
ncbi:phage portal protein [Micromonospora zamorensis]|uniref:phage portal protein n=1 Tax=Micromonospora zamorensis TaxID=709883 RepID=UPI0008200C4B|nr:phage portal protein [Micromonospora zamorensis]SCG38198.1 phage portal protein, HK97 family [Micromonospora zamorensis]